MTFTIHTTHRHVEGAGLHNEYYERNILCDKYDDIEIDDDEVRADVVEMIFNDYFAESMTAYCEQEYYATLCDRQKIIIKLLIDDIDGWDKAIEIYKSVLTTLYERRYGN